LPSSQKKRLKEAPLVSFKGEVLIVSDKWKLASQLQKSIRRGLSDEAEFAMAALLGLDAAYARYRLAVIMVEDVAAGSPAEAWEVAKGGWKKPDIEARGGAEFLVKSAGQLAEMTKDRSPCLAISCTRWAADVAAKEGDFASWGFPEAAYAAMDPSRPWQTRALAAWRCIGSDLVKSDFLPPVSGDKSRWCSIVGEHLGSLAQQWLGWSLRYQGEAHSIGMALAFSGQRESSVSIIHPPLTDLGHAGPWLSAALDRHTSEGKRALERALERTDAWEWFFARGLTRHEAIDAIARLWFWVEGVQCASSLDYDLSRRMDHDIKRDFLQRSGLDGKELMAKWADLKTTTLLAAARVESVRGRPQRQLGLG
jgi:hypothetical protein